MKTSFAFLLFFVLAPGLIVLSSSAGESSQQQQPAANAYLGFDLNTFPGTAALPVLRKNFSFAGYWLSPPPHEKANTWAGQREPLRSQGFGFLLLYTGPLTADLKNESVGEAKGTSDAQAAIAAAKHDGFPEHSIIFLDIEEGGRLSTAYHAYLRAWSTALSQAGYRAGAYCSGMTVQDGPELSISTADDIRAHPPGPGFVYFIYNDSCPPSPGCVFPENPPLPQGSGIPYAAIWQYAQSPRRKEYTDLCPRGYFTDGNCYAPADAAHSWFLDVSSASTPDPSNGR